MPESEVANKERMKTNGYSLYESQIDLVAALAEKYGTNASDVMRQFIEIAAPLYVEDMESLKRRQAARVAAV